MAASSCTAGEQAFAGGYLVLGTFFTLSVIHECTKLIHRYRNSLHYKLSPTPLWLFIVSLIFIFLSIMSLIKCILYGLVHCEYIFLSDSFQTTVFDTIFTDLYAIQLYFLWIVVLLRLYYTFKNTPYQLSKITIITYCIIFILLPLLSPLMFIPTLYDIMIVLSFSISVFISLSVIIVYCFKLFQVYRSHIPYQSTKQYQQYILQNDLDLLSIITKSTILTLIATLFSFLILLILVFVFVFTVYKIDLRYQQIIFDLCLLLDSYITAICIILQFKYLHSKYQFCCNCIDVLCRYYCNKYLNNDSQIPLPQGIIEMQQQTSVSLRPPKINNPHHPPKGKKFTRRQRVISDTDLDHDERNTDYLESNSDEDVLMIDNNNNNNNSARSNINNALSDAYKYQKYENITTRNLPKHHQHNAESLIISQHKRAKTTPRNTSTKVKRSSTAPTYHHQHARFNTNIPRSRKKRVRRGVSDEHVTVTNKNRNRNRSPNTNELAMANNIGQRHIEHQLRSSIHKNLFRNVNRVSIQNILIKQRGFDSKYTKRAMLVYEVYNVYIFFFC